MPIPNSGETPGQLTTAAALSGGYSVELELVRHYPTFVSRAVLLSDLDALVARWWALGEAVDD